MVSNSSEILSISRLHNLTVFTSTSHRIDFQEVKKIDGTIYAIGPAIELRNRAANVYEELTGSGPVTKAKASITTIGYGSVFQPASWNSEPTATKHSFELAGA